MNSPASGPVLLQVSRLSKRFGGVAALSEVDFSLQAGEVHVLLGQNGAGKSTFIKILSGALLPDGGEILLGGAPYRPRTPVDSLRAGIAVIYQEFSLVPELTVAQNIFLGHEPRRGWLVDHAAMNRRAQAVLAELGLPIQWHQRVGDLAVGDRQAVEIAKALAHECRVLILDEPTAALTERETRTLFAFIRRLRERGVGLIYVSHRLQEVARIGDRVTVFRDGQVTGQIPATTAVPELVALMTGQAPASESVQPEAGDGSGATLLQVEGLTRRGAFQDVSLRVQKGEIVGVAGLVGSGRSELLTALSGAAPADRGAVHLGGQRLRVRSPRQAAALGIGLLPNDRARLGLCLPLPVQENIVHASLLRHFRTRWVTARRERAVGVPLMESLRIKPLDPARPVHSLSGGNQQKVVLAKWLAAKTRVMLFDEPTRGVDVAAKAEMHRSIRRLVEAGVAVLVTSADCEELVELCDRILVMQSGRVTAEFPRGAVTSDQLVTAISGGE